MIRNLPLRAVSKRPLIALFAGLLTLVVSAIALAEATHLTHYAAYTEAFGQGRLAESMRHARSAWGAAEQELGDSPTTAILAYNYARLAFAYEQTREPAEQAYRRVLALNERGIGDFRRADLQIALTELALGGADPVASAEQLETLLWQRRREQLDATTLSAHAWLSLATEQLRQLDRAAAARHADIAALEAESLQPVDVDLASEAYLLAAVARLSGSHCVDYPEQIAMAIDGLEQSIALVSPLPTNPTLAARHATALQWRESAQQLADRLRRSRSHVNAQYWPRR